PEHPASPATRPGAGRALPVEQLREVRVETVRPGDLPEPTKRLPDASARTARLPRPATADELRATGARVGAAVVEIVAVHVPPRPSRQTPMLHRGHAVWLSADPDGAPPVLVSTLDWLADAREIFAV